MKESRLTKLSDETLRTKKSIHLKTSIFLLILAPIVFYLGLEAVREPNMFGENAPSPMLFNGLLSTCLIFAGLSIARWFSTKKEIEKRGLN